jgi:uncharacterized protein (DUF4213/DUF364 family)
MNWNRKALSGHELIREALHEGLVLARRHGDEPRVVDLSLDQVYVAVALSNGGQGVGLNYQSALSINRMDLAKRRDFARHLCERASVDPLLEETLLQSEHEATLSEAAVAVAIAGALAQPYMTAQCLGAPDLEIHAGPVQLGSLVHEGDTVAVIGFGGYLLAAVKEQGVRRVLVAELNLTSPIPEVRIRRRLEVLEPRMRGRSLEVHDGSDTPNLLHQAQIACITGSALCNGTLAELLQDTHDCRTVIVQGHSCGFHPAPLMGRGVHYVVQSIVDTDVVSASRASGEEDFAQRIDHLLPRKRTISRVWGA